MWLGSRQQVTKTQMQCQTLTLDGVEIEFCTELVCLGVMFDHGSICRTHQATCWKMFLPSAAAAHCWPDADNGCSQYISPCFYNQSRGLVQQCFGNASAVNLYPLQLVLHAAARVITLNRKYDHISATIIDQLHWLPVKQRIGHTSCALLFTSVYTM